MMSSAPKEARLAIIAHVTHLVNRDYDVSRTMCLSSTIAVMCISIPVVALTQQGLTWQLPGLQAICNVYDCTCRYFDTAG